MILNENDIHLWLVKLDQFADSGTLQLCTSLLDKEEQAKADRFYFARHRQRFLVTRGVIRTLLSEYDKSTAPADWIFSASPNGKPFISAPRLSEVLYFNISHSKDRIVFALARHPQIGLDIEAVAKERDVLSIGRRYFSEAEYEALKLLPVEHRESRFYDLWTLKESCIKANDCELVMSLKQFVFDFPDGNTVCVSFDSSVTNAVTGWRFWQFEDDANYRLALALRTESGQENMKVKTRQLTSMSSNQAITLGLRHVSE